MLLAFSAQAQELPFTHYTSDDLIRPLPSNGVTDIHQDDVGFVWFALSGAGLVRYDGREMEHFTIESGLPDPNVDGLLQDAGGRLWIASYAGLSVSEKPVSEYRTFDPVRFSTTFCGVNLLDSSAGTNAVATDSLGGVWVGTASLGVLRYRCDDGTAHVDTFGTGDGGRNEEVYALALRADGSLWASISGGSLLRLEASVRSDSTGRRGSFSTVLSDGLDATTTDLLEDSRGALWGGTYDGRLWRLGESGTQDVVAELGHWIRDMVEGPDGTLWIGSTGGGLMRYDSDGPYVITRRQGLLSETVYGLGFDREGNLFVGQSQGASKLPGNYRAFEYYTAVLRTGAGAALPAASVTAILPEAGRTWIATPGGLVAVLPGEELHTITVEDGLPTNELYALGRDADGTIWLGLNGQTTALHRPHVRPPTVGRTQSAAFNIGADAWRATSFRLFNVYAIRTLDLLKSRSDSSRTPSTWFASFMKVACLLEGEWFTFRQDAGFPATASGAVAVDDSERVWIATDDNGLYRSRSPLYADSIRALHARHPGDRDSGREVASPVFEPVWTVESGAPTNTVTTLARHAGRLWLGTPAGLFVTSSTSLDVRPVDGMSGRSVVALDASERDGTMWVGTNDGLFQVDSTLAVVRELRRVDGLLNEETSFINSVVAEDGAVYFGSPKGLTVYYPRLDRPNEMPPKVVLRHVRYEDRSWGRNRFEAEFAALTFRRERAVRYQTRFVNYDEAWSTETREGSIQMTNLPAFFIPRDYTLEVRARNGAGIPSEEVLRHAFAVRPEWFASWWFVLGVLGVLGSGVYAAHRRRLRRERFEHEVHSARTIQERLQPAEPLQIDSVEIAGACVPAYEVGGDHFDYRWIESERRVLVLLVDVEGKRMEGAFQAAVVRGMVAMLEDLHRDGSLSDAASRLNRMIYETLSAETAVAAIVAVVDVDTGRIVYVNAGCELPLLLRDGRTRRIEQPGAFPPFGKVRGVRYGTFAVQLEPGDILAICSDGVTEARDAQGEPYRRRLNERLVQTSPRTARSAVRSILQDVDAFTDGGRSEDDRTIIIIRRH